MMTTTTMRKKTNAKRPVDTCKCSPAIVCLLPLLAKLSFRQSSMQCIYIDDDDDTTTATIQTIIAASLLSKRN